MLCMPYDSYDLKKLKNVLNFFFGGHLGILDQIICHLAVLKSKKTIGDLILQF